MSLWEVLHDKQDAVIARWLDSALATYSKDAVLLFGREKDKFANPVGHSLREGTRGIVEAFLDREDFAEADFERIRQYLREIVRIRAVQEFTASQAIGFVFHLKDAVRKELGKAADNPSFSRELLELDRRIDRIALAAFDVYVECREQVYELRVNEAKRRVSWVLDKMNRPDADSGSAHSGPKQPE